MSTSSLNLNKYFQQVDGLSAQLVFSGFMFVGYGIGVISLFSVNWWLNVFGITLLSKMLIVTTYLLNKFSFHGFFKIAALNLHYCIDFSALKFKYIDTMCEKNQLIMGEIDYFIAAPRAVFITAV